MKVLKKQQTHLIQSQDGEIYLTLEYVGNNDYCAHVKLLDNEEAKKTAKKEKYKLLQL
jgi:hypothetical protein